MQSHGLSRRFERIEFIRIESLAVETNLLFKRNEPVSGGNQLLEKDDLTHLVGQ